MNWKNRLRRVEEDADDDDGDGEENDDDEDDDHDDYEGVLNGGLAEFRLLFLRRNSAGYALDAKLLTKPKDGGGNDVEEIFARRKSHVAHNPRFSFLPENSL